MNSNKIMIYCRSHIDKDNIETIRQRTQLHHGSVDDPAPGEDETHGAVHLGGTQGRVHHRGPGQRVLHAVRAASHGAGSDMVRQ